MSAKKKTAKKPATRSSKKAKRQPVVPVHSWFNPFHNHVHANLKSWLTVIAALVILVAALTIFE